MPFIASTYLPLLQFVNPAFWSGKTQVDLANVLHDGLSDLRAKVMDTNNVRAGEAFTFETACCQIVLHCQTDEWPTITVGVMPTHKNYGDRF